MLLYNLSSKYLTFPQPFVESSLVIFRRLSIEINKRKTKFYKHIVCSRQNTEGAIHSITEEECEDLFYKKNKNMFYVKVLSTMTEDKEEFHY